MPNLNRFDILSISIFCKIALSISISISIFSKITISISISISIFLELPYRYRYFSELPYQYRYRYFQKWPYRYWYWYFSKVSIYRQSICHIDISNRATCLRAWKGWERRTESHSTFSLFLGMILKLVEWILEAVKWFFKTQRLRSLVPVSCLCVRQWICNSALSFGNCVLMATVRT